MKKFAGEIQQECTINIDDVWKFENGEVKLSNTFNPDIVKNKKIQIKLEFVHENGFVIAEKINIDDHYLYAHIFFNPQKYDSENDMVVFRPLHSSSLIDQITAVAMLNILIYDFNIDNRILMSNFSRLIPHNFYGNRVAYEPEKLFKPWQEQYKEYTTKANDYYKNFHGNRLINPRIFKDKKICHNHSMINT